MIEHLQKKTIFYLNIHVFVRKKYLRPEGYRQDNKVGKCCEIGYHGISFGLFIGNKYLHVLY